ncbi:SorB family sulfite dehydrogenase c-type cytochrome subunit [Methyloparacoccus murrellii]
MRRVAARGLLAAIGVCLVMAPALALDIVLPRDSADFAPSELPGYALVRQNCLVCHSAHYVLYQPPSSTRGYWDATVRKMKWPFGALFADEDIAPMVDYLVRTYGAERPGQAAGQP